MADRPTLAGSAWHPVEIGGRPMPAGTRLFIRFEAGGKIAGNGGCNKMFGAYRIDAVNLRIGPLGITRKACTPDIMALEAVFLEALEETRLYLRTGPKLTLKSAQGATTLRLVQSDWD